jgi:glycosyltransferase involved in cell wall biosynthesis
MMSVTIGIHVDGEPERLRTTTAALAREGVNPVVLGEPTAPASFNRLAADTRRGAVVLLESGAIPAPGALERLVAALAAPGVGIAGPSTNLAWNEQCAFPGGRAADVARTGQEALRRYGDETRSLGPLWGPADFCIAVRREVIEAIGGADEGFAAGPCWEMEYCARAVRAGFDARWVCAAYVWRAPYSARRRRNEARMFDASKRRYQDNLCALRLRDSRPGYEPHCRGDACEHFAPRELITLRRPLPPAPRKPTIAVSAPRQPLVSCVMPTRDRAEFALHAIDLFRRQDYPERELLVVDDGDDDLERRLPADARVRYLSAPRGESIGAKRNRAIQEARGEFVAQWDDDDWYGPARLSIQLAPLLAGRAELTGLTCPLFFELEAWRFWRVTPTLHRRLFVGDVHGGTLAFARRVWERARYPSLSLAEDAALLARARSHGARLERVDGDGHFVYLRHCGNAWRFACGRHLDRSGWQPGPEPAFPPEDRAFYAARSRAARHNSGPPLVSCIMPTAGRRAWVSYALDYFARQDYAERELIVLDDGDDRVDDLVPDDPRIRYIGLDERLVLGEKRNRACELARGEIVVHWDDDDWHAPHRLRYQVEQLERHGAAVCGITRVLYIDPARRAAWRYDHLGSSQSWVAGNALAYRRSLWEEQHFPPVQVGEDSRFLAGRRATRPLVLDDHRFLVGVVHAGNTSPKRTAGPCWKARPLDEVRALLGADWERYES